jgi:hypothetical protein
LYPDRSNDLFVETPPPPGRLPDNLDTATKLLAGWAATLVGSSHGGKPYWPLRVLRGKTAGVVRRAAAALNEHDVPPVDFLWWQLATWRGVQGDIPEPDRKPPPVAWLFSLKRIEKAAGCSFAPGCPLLKLTPLAREYASMRRYLSLRGATVAEVDALRDLLARAQAETRAEQGRIREALAAGRYLWT